MLYHLIFMLSQLIIKIKGNHDMIFFSFSIKSPLMVLPAFNALIKGEKSWKE